MNWYFHSSSIVDDGAVIGDGTSIWHFSHVMGGARIGSNCTLGQNVFIASNVVIGNYAKIQNNVSIYEGVELEDYVFCGPSMVFTNVMKPRCLYPQRGTEFYQRTLVKRGASIGANATVVCGTQIGEHAMIAAGAVVTRNVPAYALVAGVPAKFLSWVCMCGSSLKTAGDRKWICENCNCRYNLNKDNSLALQRADSSKAGNIETN